MAAALRLSTSAPRRLGSIGRHVRPRLSGTRLLAVDASAAASTSIIDTAVAPIQSGLLVVHETTGLPWWATLALTAVSMRTAFLPVVYYQLHASERLMQAMPTVAHLHSLLKRKLADLESHCAAATPTGAGSTSINGGATSSQSRVELLLAFGRGARASLRLHRASPWTAVASPLLTIPALGTAVLATRGLVDGGGYGLDTGGLAWVQDLTVSDPTLALPMMAVASTYFNLELSLGSRGAVTTASNASDAHSSTASSTSDKSRGDEVDTAASADGSALHPAASDRSGGDASLVANKDGGGVPRAETHGAIDIFRDGLQTVLICGLPLVSTLPAGAFAFWLTSSAWTTAQIMGLRHPQVRRALGLKTISGTSNQPTK